MFDPHYIKQDFPIFNRTINGKPLVYLDNAATSQKPRCVIDALKNYYETINANVHRGIYTLSEEATEAYEATREKVRDFINARSEKEIIFTRNCTEAINLVAYTWARKNIKKGDEIMVSAFEHHSNLVPWQELTREKEAHLRVIPLNDNLRLDMGNFSKILSKKTKLVCVTAMSNAVGVMPNTQKIIEKAHEVGAKVLIDGAQSITHMPTDVQKLDCDFFAFSSHKMFGPTGVGVLYARKKILETMPPFLYGGEMVLTVEQHKAEYNELPWRFEAGTPNIADTIAFKSAFKYLEKFDWAEIKEHGKKLLRKAKETFSKYPAVKLYTPEKEEHVGPILSFTIDGVHPHDIATIFNEEGVAIRSGQHCAEPLLHRLGVDATARMSFSIYNTVEDIDRAEKALQKVLHIFTIHF